MAVNAKNRQIRSVPCIVIDYYIQGSTNRRAPGCVNAAGKLRQSGKQEQEQNSPNLVPAY